VAHSGAPIANWCPMAGSGTAQMRLEPDRSSGLRDGIDGRGPRRLGARSQVLPNVGQHLQSRALCRSAAGREIARPLPIRPVCGAADQPVAQGPFSAVSMLGSRCWGLDAARPRRCPASTLPGLDAARPAVSMLRSRSRVPGQRGGDRDRSAPRRPCGPVIGQTGRSFRSVAPGQTGWRSCPVEPRLDRSPSTCRAGLTHPRPACREARA
jgi:hypothetical protein